MPEKIRLPDGRYVSLSLDPAKAKKQRDAIDLIYGTPQSATPDVDTKNFWDNPLEGFKAVATSTIDAIPQIGSSLAQTSIGLVTPHVDLPIEKRLREAAAKKARERDPNYATSQAVGMGLGQVGTMTAMRLIPHPVPQALSRMVGISLNMSETMTRIAEYEKRTGTDVPWWKESTMHLLGGIIGLSEQWTPSQLAGAGGFGDLIRQIDAGAQRKAFTQILKGVGVEGFQEGMANVAQSLAARVVYDADGMDNVISASMEEAKVGGIVGGIANASQRIILGRYAKYVNPYGLDQQMEEALRQGQHRNKSVAREAFKIIDPNSITSDLHSIMSEGTTVTQGLADDILRSLGGQASALPFGMESVLRQGNIDEFSLDRLIAQTRNSTQKLMEELRASEGSVSDQDKQQFADAQNVVTQIMQPRLQKLFEIKDIVAESPTQGGLQDVPLYNQNKAVDIETADKIGFPDIVPNVSSGVPVRVTSSRSPQEVALFISELEGGAYGLAGKYKNAENLGVHGGVGVDPSRIQDLSVSGADPNYSSSNTANYEVPTISAYLFGGIDPSEATVLGGLQLPYLGENADVLARIETRIEALSDEETEAQKAIPFTRQRFEESTGQKVSDEEWGKIGPANLEKLNEVRKTVFTEISQLTQQRSDLYLQSIDNNIQTIRQAAMNNLAVAEEGSKKLGFENTQQFYVWINGMADRIGRLQGKVNENKEELANSVAEAAKKLQDADPDKTVAEIRAELEESGTIKRLTAKYPVHSKEFSTKDAINLTRLFTSEERAEGILNQLFTFKAQADVATWVATQDRYFSVGESAIPIKEDGQLEVVKEFYDNYDSAQGTTESDIEKLLAIKNIKLRDSGLMESLLDGQLASGVNSAAFRNLLEDLTGANTWAEASEAQRYLMYSRLVQLAPNYSFRDRDKQMAGFTEIADPIYLPNFYSNPEVEGLYQPILSIVADVQQDMIAEGAGVTTPGFDLNIGIPVQRIKQIFGDAIGRQGGSLNGNAFDEAMARLVETDVLVADGSNVLINEVNPPRNEPLSTPESEQRNEDLDWTRYVDTVAMERELLSDDTTDTVDDLLESYNERAIENNEPPLDKESFVKQFSGELAKMTGKSELKRLGLLGSVGASLAEDIQPSRNSFLSLLEGKQGRTVARALVSKGLLPVSLEDGLYGIRSNYMNRIRKTYDLFKNDVRTILDDLRVTRGLPVKFVDEFGGVFQALDEVGINNVPEMDTRVAMYDTVGGRILINLANIDPDGVLDASQIIKEQSFQAGLHSLDIRDNYSPADRVILWNYVKDNIVPEKVNAEMHKEGLTWVEKHILETAGSGLTQADIEAEAVVDMLTNLSMGNIPTNKASGAIGAIKNKVNKYFSGVIGAAKDSGLDDVLKVFNNIRGGQIGRRGAGYEGEQEKAPLHSIRSMRLTQYASPENKTKLRESIERLNKAKTPKEKLQHQKVVDKISDNILNTATQISAHAEKATGFEGTLKELVNNVGKQAELIQNAHGSSVPLMGMPSMENKESVKTALHEFMRILDGNKAYTMPARYRGMFASQTNLNESGLEYVKRGIKDGTIKEVKGDPMRNVLEKDGPLSGEIGVGSNPTEMKNIVENGQSGIIENLRYKFLDRREWSKQQTERLLAQRDQAMINAETSALVAMRNADSAVNLLPGLMRLGPLRYTGTTALGGRFVNTPVYSESLEQTYGGDGRIPGLSDIMFNIQHVPDQQLALDYGEAKRILSKKKTLDEIEALVQAMPEGAPLTPELEQRYERAKYKYDAANPYKAAKTRKWTQKKLQEVVKEVEAGIVYDKNGQIVSLGDNGHVRKFWDYYQAYNNEMINFAYQTGLISIDQRDEYLSEDYMPFYRETADLMDSLEFGSEAYMKTKGINLVEKALDGSLLPISENIFESININIQALVRDGLMNTALVRTVEEAMELREATKISVGELGAKADKSVVRVMEQGEVAFYRLQDEKLAMSAMLAGHNPRKYLKDSLGNVGKEQLIESGPRKGQPKKFLGLKEKEQGWIADLGASTLMGPAQFLRESVTKTPSFMQKNVFRDSLQAFIIFGGNPRLISDAIRNAMDTESRVRAQELGLSIGIDFVAEPGKFGETMKKEFEKHKRLQGYGKNILHPTYLWWQLSALGDQTESAARLAVYDRVLAVTGDKALAQNMALEIMNYGRRGASPFASAWMATIPFINGRLQGLDVTLRSHQAGFDVPGLSRWNVEEGRAMTQAEYNKLGWLDRNVGKVISRGMMIASMSFFYEMMMNMFDEDDKYKNMRPDQKFDNWMLPLGAKAWLKVPTPFEVGILYKVIPQLLYELGWGDENFTIGDAGRELQRQARHTLSFQAFPQTFQPLVDGMMNKNKYQGGDIVSYFDMQKDPILQRDIHTSDIAVLSSQMLNRIPGAKDLPILKHLTSPQKMAYIQYNYGGTMTSYVTKLTNRVFRSGVIPGIDKKAVVGTSLDFDIDVTNPKKLYKAFTEGEGLANLPVFGDLWQNPEMGGKWKQDLFDVQQELTSAVASINAFTEEDRIKGYKYSEQYKGIVTFQNTINSYRRQMAIFSDVIDILQKRTDLSRSEKRIRMDNIMQAQHSMLSGVPQIIKRMREVQKVYDKLLETR